MTRRTKSKAQNLKQKVKARIPKDWMSEVRITYRIAMETIKGIAQAGLVNIAIITTIAAILTIFGSIFRVTLALDSFIDSMGSALEISAYLSPEADVNETVGKIKELEHVKKVTFISKDASWAQLKREIDVPDISNPLPDTLHVKLDDTKNISKLMTQLKTIKGINDTSYAKDLVQKFEMINAIINTATLIFVAIVCVLTIAIINNTIELVIQSRKEEIEIMRLMGVSNWYIKTPLILQGAIYGFLGALVAIIPIDIVQSYIIKMHEFFMITIDPWAQFTVLFSVLTLGVAFSSVGSFLSIKKHLQV
ncbi:MAG: permease-like cell division protein FtsX [Candidatus Gastranaerophilales bacterium]|nr:permease-like cell division protein FtsX [Candidatus Gastranaerophilales bacterium]